MDRERDSGVDFNDENSSRLRMELEKCKKEIVELKEENKYIKGQFLSLQEAYQALLVDHRQNLFQQTAKEKEENKYIKGQFPSLEEDYQALLVDHGQNLFEQTAKEKEERRSKLLQKPSRQSSEIQRDNQSSSTSPRGIYSIPSTREDDPPSTPRDSPIPSTRDDPPFRTRDTPLPSTREDDPPPSTPRDSPITSTRDDPPSRTRGDTPLPSTREDDPPPITPRDSPITSTRDDLTSRTRGDTPFLSTREDVAPHSTRTHARIPSARDDPPSPSRMGDSNLSIPEANPTLSEATNLQQPYQTLLLTILKALHTSEKEKLKSWANQRFSLQDSQSAEQILFQLDRSSLISATNLSHLKEFFQSINRIDLLHTIDGFLQSDYSFLHQVQDSLAKAKSR